MSRKFCQHSWRPCLYSTRRLCKLLEHTTVAKFPKNRKMLLPLPQMALNPLGRWPLATEVLLQRQPHPHRKYPRAAQGGLPLTSALGIPVQASAECHLIRIGLQGSMENGVFTFQAPR